MRHRSTQMVKIIAVILAAAQIIHGAAATYPSVPDLTQLAIDSAHLGKDQVRAMELGLLSKPDDAATRAKLLGYYFPRQAETIRQRLEQTMWIIWYRSTDPFAGSEYCRIDADLDPQGYARVIALWQQLQTKDPDNLALLRNAANAYSPADDAVAEELLLHGGELQPKNPEWPLRVARLYEFRAQRSPEHREKTAAMALAQRQKGCDLEHDANRRFAAFTEIPRDAFVSGDYIRAKRSAQQLIAMAESFRGDPNYGNAIHVGNIVLGRVAIHMGDIQTAEACLLAASQTPGSAQLSSTGPDMSLAKELLERGSRENVRDYLIRCEKFWTAGSARLKTWIAAVDAGGTPDFGPQAIE